MITRKTIKIADVVIKSEVTDTILEAAGLDREIFERYAGQKYDKAEIFEETITHEDGETEINIWVRHPNNPFAFLSAMVEEV